MWEKGQASADQTLDDAFKNWLEFLPQLVRRPVPFQKLGLLVTTGGLLFALGCSREQSPGVEKPGPASAVEQPATDSTVAFAATLPHVGGPAGYAGSKTCRSCHTDQFESWHRSYHRTMTQIAAADTVQADFHNVALTNDSVRFVLSQKSNEFRVHMERSVPATASETSPESLDVRVGLVTGSHHMQVFWLPGGEGNAQV